MILCCGEALIDMLPRETAAGEGAFAPYAGGAVFNTAIALGRLGAPAGFFCPLSDDLFGAQLRAGLDASGVDHSLSPAVDRPCTLAFVTLIDGQARYAFYDRGTALREMTIAELPELPDTVGALFFGGISLVGDPCGAGYEALCARAGARVVMLDPNIRPGFIRDEAGYRARLDRMLAQADIVKLSDEDLHWLMGDGEIDALAHDLRARGPQVVVITEGAKGARAFWSGGVAQVRSQRVAVVDTVGAGDTFNAGFLRALEQSGALTKAGIAAIDDAQLTAALELGAKAAAVTVSRAGANPPWAHEI
ncbi:carbohydrate kinase family protein [Roseinatronobacter alkalisoli]|uniref:Carbohydrate kinase n=1 Tax=Roseinatronobacter alkalisoli TaxID=3028235 RepID=A0ABT5T5I0_9RHOB|nr:carbohydrate kinase [Roseinatronobacter sp. HJB301]MDD7970377.1 carbohydrate kinase [Roseinatronobacter sp. HJB301]